MLVKPDFVSILIQGVFHENTIKTIDQYINKFEIVVSTYDYPNHLINHKNLTVVHNKLKLLKGTYNRQNIYYQVNTTLNGLKKCTKTFVLKLRSDEFYSNIESINFSDKILTNNFLLRKWDYSPFHFSDHFILANRNLLINSFKDLKIFLCKRSNYLNLKNQNTPAESIIFSFIFFNKVGLCYSTEGLYKLGFENTIHFEIIDVKNLSPYILRCSSVNHDITDLDNFIKTDIALNLDKISKVDQMKNRSSIRKIINRIQYKLKRMYYAK